MTPDRPTRKIRRARYQSLPTSRASRQSRWTVSLTPAASGRLRHRPRQLHRRAEEDEVDINLDFGGAGGDVETDEASDDLDLDFGD